MSALAKIKYKRPPLYLKQREAFYCPARYSLIEGSTKSGKTVGSMSWLLEQTIFSKPKSNTVWVAPIYAQAKIAFRRYVRGLPKNICKPNKSDLLLEFPGDRIMFFKGGDNPDSIYGDDYAAAIIDEATRTSQETYNAVRSTLTATSGPLRAIANVRGRLNWHYKMCRKAESKTPGYAYHKLVAQDAVDAGVLPQSEIDDARQNLVDRVFKELYECIPSDDGGNPFGQVALRACIKPGLSKKPPKWFGVDLAKSYDWTVIVGLDEDGNVCLFERWQTPWRETIAKLRSIIGDIPALVDSTGVGDPIVEELQVGHGNVEGFKFSMPSKQQLMEGLTLAIQQKNIGYPDGVIVAELDTFEYKYMPSGVRYTAPEGYHDDCVYALALAQTRRMTPIDGMGVFEYYRQNFEDKTKPKEKKPGETSWH